MIWVILPILIVCYSIIALNNYPKCPRCRARRIDRANFCGKCGHMLKSHHEVEQWLRNQREMLEERRRLKACTAETDVTIHLRVIDRATPALQRLGRWFR